jgi:hypothetical protein
MAAFLRSMAAGLTDVSSWPNIGEWLHENERKKA